MLEYRHDELKIRTNNSIHSSGEQLRRITEHAVTGNDFMTRLTADIHKDSKFIKIITFIALLYTPVSLIAVSAPSEIPRSNAANSALRLYLVLIWFKY